MREYQLDIKGRITIPLSICERLKSKNHGRKILAALIQRGRWEGIFLTKIKGFDNYKKVEGRMIDLRSVSFDSKGRVALPEHFLKRTGLGYSFELIYEKLSELWGLIYVLNLDAASCDKIRKLINDIKGNLKERREKEKQAISRSAYIIDVKEGIEIWETKRWEEVKRSKVVIFYSGISADEFFIRGVYTYYPNIKKMLEPAHIHKKERFISIVKTLSGYYLIQGTDKLRKFLLSHTEESEDILPIYKGLYIPKRIFVIESKEDEFIFEFFHPEIDMEVEFFENLDKKSSVLKELKSFMKKKNIKKEHLSIIYKFKGISKGIYQKKNLKESIEKMLAIVRKETTGYFALI